MLERTFIHLPAVGAKRELAIWRAGIRDWRDFLARGEERLAPMIYRLGRPVVQRSLEALGRPDAAAVLAQMIPAAEHWRMWPRFGRVVFLDIETGGDPAEWGGVTVVGLYDGQRVAQLVADHNMWLINDCMKGYDVVVTFSGASFDIPVLKQNFPLAYIPPIHIDLRWCLKRLGYQGGLKRIEKQLGINRPDHLKNLDGYQAIKLWQAHQAGDPQALSTLLAYNAEDIINLKPLLELSAAQLGSRLRNQARD